jgi:hypothetical protein
MLAACTALSGCALLGSLWPFGDDDTGHVPPPENATQYHCNSNASFWLRSLPDNAKWVIYPDRQIRLDPDKDNPKHYTNGVATLTLDNGAATLTDGPRINYSNCTVAKGK